MVVRSMAKKRCVYSSTVYLLFISCLTSIHIILLFCCRVDGEGSEETMDTESEKASTLSNDVYKQVQILSY